MPKDFKNTWTQKSWEYSLGSYSRAQEVLKLIKSTGRSIAGTSYWENVVVKFESKYGTKYRN